MQSVKSKKSNTANLQNKSHYMGRKWILVVLVALIGILTAGGPVRAQDAGGALEQLLSQVPDNQISRTAIWYGSLNDLEQLLGFQLNSVEDFQKLQKAQ